MCLAQGPQHSDAGEARTRGLSVSHQALYHWVTALPIFSEPNSFMHMFHDVYIVLAKYQIAPSQAVVGVDRPVYGL